MRKLQNIISFLVLTCFTLLAAQAQNAIDSQGSLEGSWTLVKYKYGEEAQYLEVPKLVTYVKNLTKSRFSWASYGEGGELLTAGGGRYSLENGKYREEIDYFHPMGSNLPGTYVDWDYSINGNTWEIGGYVKNVQLNPGSGKFEQVDSVKLGEIWRRL